MIRRHLAFILVTLFTGIAHAQSAAELLQKGVYSQETMGDLDSAIQIYRQTLAMPGVSRQVAARAQYQLVLCMLQKGDRNAASHELDALAKNFSDQQDLIAKARKLIPGAGTAVAPSWSTGEASQLNIKRNGEFTGEYLYYSVTPWEKMTGMKVNPAASPDDVIRAQLVYLGWNLVTKSSTRSIQIAVDRMTLMRPNAKFGSEWVSNNDALGDPLAIAFAGPAVDAEPLVFQMRLMPLAVGYKTTLTTLPFVLGHGVPQTVELAVTAVEPVQTVAGKFSCYKVVFASLGQTFWFTVDSAHSLVKFQSGNVEAELVKTWGPTAFEDALSFLANAGCGLNSMLYSLQQGSAKAYSKSKYASSEPQIDITMWRLYTAPKDIESSLQSACTDTARNYTNSNHEAWVRPGSVQERTFGGHRAVSCFIDTKSGGNPGPTTFVIWVRSESLMFQFRAETNSSNVGTFRWEFEPILDTIKIP